MKLNIILNIYKMTLHVALFLSVFEQPDDWFDSK